MEQHADNRLIRPRADYTGPAYPAPYLPLEQRGTRDNDYYPGYDVKSEHDPAFVQPFVKTVPTSRSSGVRVGLSGWTAPAVPYDIPQATGGAAFGITFMWPVPIPATGAPPAPEAGGQR